MFLNRFWVKRDVVCLVVIVFGFGDVEVNIIARVSVFREFMF